MKFLFRPREAVTARDASLKPKAEAEAKAKEGGERGRERERETWEGG